jgi:6-phosphogluconolactonase (cycloisomerase 2 family)
MRTIVLGLGLLAMLVLASVATAAKSDNSPGAVYTLTNSPAGNAVVAFSRAADGTLTAKGSFATGGSGAGSGLGSHGAVVLSNDGGQLFAVNAGSNTISLFGVYTANAAAGTISGFSVGHDGTLALLDPSGASASLGATSHPLDEAVSNNGQFLYNLTDGLHTISAFRIAEDGGLVQVGSIEVPAGAAGLAVK